MSKLVIVDADAPFAESVVQSLQPHGFTAATTPDGDGALELIKQQRPDLIILNVELAKGSGYSLCNRLKRNVELGGIPLILTSSQATQEAFAQHQKTNTRADAYLLKPIDVAALVDKARQLAPLAFVEKSDDAGAAAGFGSEAVLSVEERGAADGSLGDGAPARPAAPARSAAVARPGRSARGPSLDELLNRSRPEEAPLSLPPQAGPEAKQQFLRDTLRRREADITRARELWSAREREVQALEDALDSRTRDLDQHRDELRDVQVRLAAAEERNASMAGENAILEERVQRLDREKEALLQEADASREAHERELQSAEERYAALEQQKARERDELEGLLAERATEVGQLSTRLDETRAAAAAEAAQAHEREMALQRDRDRLQGELDESLGTNEGLNALLKTETETRVRLEHNLADVQKAKAEGEKAADKLQNELHGKVRDLTRERSDLEVERENALAELAQRADQIVRLETRISDLEAEVAEGEGKTTDLERDVYERNRTIEELTGELQARNDRINGLEDDLARALERGQQLDQRLAEARAQAEKEAKERSETERQLRDEIARLDGTVKERELRIRTLEADVQRLQAALDASRAERDSFAERLGERDAELAEEQRSHAETRANLEGQLAREKKAAAEQKAAADRKDAEQQGRILQLETELSATQERLAQTESELAATKAKLGETDRTLRQTRATLDETTAEREQLKGQVADLQGQLRRKTESEQRLNAELSAAQGRIATLEHEVEALREQHGLEKGELDAALVKSEERARAKIGELNEQMADARNQIDDYRNQVDNLQIQGQSLESELLALRAERDGEARNRADAESRVDALTRTLTEEKDKREKGERERAAQKKAQEKLEKARDQLQQDAAAAEARHKVELDSVRSELRLKERSITEANESQARDKAAKEREKQALQRTLDDEKRTLTSKIDELTRRLERSEARATAAEGEASKERTARVRESATAKVAAQSMQTRMDALEQQVAQGGGGAMQAQLEKSVKDKDERIEDLENEIQMIQATLTDASGKNKRLQEELARKTVGGAEAAELRKKYNELVTRYKQREEERKKLFEDLQKTQEQLSKARPGAKAVREPG